MRSAARAVETAVVLEQAVREGRRAWAGRVAVAAGVGEQTCPRVGRYGSKSQLSGYG